MADVLRFRICHCEMAMGHHGGCSYCLVEPLFQHQCGEHVWLLEAGFDQSRDQRVMGKLNSTHLEFLKNCLCFLLTTGASELCEKCFLNNSQKAKHCSDCCSRVN